MTTDPDLLLAKARKLWEELALAPVSFERAAESEDRVHIVVAPRSRTCPQGWAGVVALGDAAIVTAPDEASAAVLRTAFAGHGRPVRDLTETDVVRSLLSAASASVAETLGPATLAYLDPHDYHHIRATVEGTRITPRPATHEDVKAVTVDATAEEVDEAEVTSATSPVFVVTVDGEPAAACGYADWVGTTAQLSVLTATKWRGRGLAKHAASAAVGHALADNLLPQWRARLGESRAVAAALGFRELGAQLSFRLSTGDES